MTKILDYLVENYIYVAAISGFLIIVLIGYLVKDKRKKRKKENKKEEIEGSVVSLEKQEEKVEMPVLNENSVDKKMEFVKGIEEENTFPIVNEIEEITKVGDEPSLPTDDNQSFDINNVEPSNNKFQVVLDPQTQLDMGNNVLPSNEIEVFDLDDTVVFDKRKLDDEVDIVDFGDINKLQTDDVISNSTNEEN